MARTADVVVVGLGPGGEDLAGRLAGAGLDVVAVEDSLVGGECPYWGCVPSKMMIRAADLIAEGRRIDGLAGSAEVTPSWAPVARRIRDEATDSWDDTVAADRLTGKGITLLRGRGRLSGPKQVTVDAPNGDVVDVVDARVGVVLNTGTTPAIPAIEGLHGTPYWTNHEAIETEEVPESLVVLGGGAVGLELAQVFSRFGAAVTVLEVAPRILAVEEPESSELLTTVFTREGIDVRAGVSISRVTHDGGRFTLTVDGEEVSADRLLVAAGRATNLGTLGLFHAGIEPTSRFLDIDEHCRAADGLWAIGDITGRGQFTHVSMYQSPIAVRSIVGEKGPAADYRALPRVTFTEPEVGAVGLTEAEARERGIDVQVGHAAIPESSRGWIHKAGNDGFIKLVADASRGVLVGATSAGPVGGEVLSGLLVAVHAEVPVETLRTMIYTYPTFHRAIETAVNALA